jgi:hypothetical protein
MCSVTDLKYHSRWREGQSVPNNNRSRTAYSRSKECEVANSQSSCQHLRLCSDECNRLKMRWFKLTINSYKYNEIMIWFKKQNRLVTEWKSYNYHTNRNQLQMCLPSLEKSHEIRSKRLPTRGWDFLIISWLDIKDSSTMIILKVNKAAF